MGLWARVVAAGYDRIMAGAEEAGLARHRRELLAAARGRVLEIGGGTGANLGYYDGGVSELVIAEPEEAMARRLERKLRRTPLPARVLRAPAERLPVADGTFDCVVSTLVLCSVADPLRALGEVRRVLRPEGRLLFIEHVRAREPALARWQDRLRAPWAWVACGCQCNRPTLDAIGRAGLAVTELRHERLPKAPSIVKPLVIGAAARA